MLPMTAGQVRENLADAGCSAELIGQFEKLAAKGKQKEVHLLLDGYRRNLLESIHDGQRKLDCLDYLIYYLNEQAAQAR